MRCAFPSPRSLAITAPWLPGPPKSPFLSHLGGVDERRFSSQSWSRRGTLWQGLIVGLGASVPEVVGASGEVERPPRVLDTRELLSDSARNTLEELSSKLEGRTGFKLFVVSQGMRELSENLAALKKRVGIDAGSLIVTVGPEASSRPGGLIGITRGSLIDQRFKYRFTTAYDAKAEKTFGKADYIQSKGYDGAVTTVARHMAACLFLVAEDKDNFDCGASLLPDSRVQNIMSIR
eukprot:CAMPEP_0117533400 /NCGR_PEP_ID=MMETSP0784-20121206/39869_1 /TAXON_ID=39447 /ORGANISM="" /LENGTH=234 /DNA_ID=CAMNT_0005329833 /DNA_START=140 /DNA_END=844 /DNA_ORIENTATION=+